MNPKKIKDIITKNNLITAVMAVEEGRVDFKIINELLNMNADSNNALNLFHNLIYIKSVDNQKIYEHYKKNQANKEYFRLFMLKIYNHTNISKDSLKLERYIKDSLHYYKLNLLDEFAFVIEDSEIFNDKKTLNIILKNLQKIYETTLVDEDATKKIKIFSKFLKLEIFKDENNYKALEYLSMCNYTNIQFESIYYAIKELSGIDDELVINLIYNPMVNFKSLCRIITNSKKLGFYNVVEKYINMYPSEEFCLFFNNAEIGIKCYRDEIFDSFINNGNLFEKTINFNIEKDNEGKIKVQNVDFELFFRFITFTKVFNKDSTYIDKVSKMNVLQKSLLIAIIKALSDLDISFKYLNHDVLDNLLADDASAIKYSEEIIYVIKSSKEQLRSLNSNLEIEETEIINENSDLEDYKKIIEPYKKHSIDLYQLVRKK